MISTSDNQVTWQVADTLFVEPDGGALERVTLETISGTGERTRSSQEIPYAWELRGRTLVLTNLAIFQLIDPRSFYDAASAGFQNRHVSADVLLPVSGAP